MYHPKQRQVRLHWFDPMIYIEVIPSCDSAADLDGNLWTSFARGSTLPSASPILKR